MRSIAPFSFALTALVACGGSSAPVASPEPTTPVSVPDDTPKKAATRPSVSQELGEIDPRAVENTFTRIRSKIVSCHKAGTSRVEYLSGEVKFFLRIGEDGKARWGFLEHSTLGDRETEKCMLRAMTDSSWPLPRGGDAEVRKEIAFDIGDARAPIGWHPDKVVSALPKVREAAQKCGKFGQLDATMYVVADGNGGKAEAAGVAGGGKEGEAAADCVSEVLRTAKWPSPGSWSAKVSFKL